MIGDGMRLPFAVPALLLLSLAGEVRAGEDPGREFESCMARAREAAARWGQARDAARAKEAMDAYAEASRLRPADPLPPAEAGLLAIETGDGAAAVRLLERVHGIDPESGPFHFLRGSLLRVRGEFLDAREEFRAAKGAGFRPAASADRFFDCTVGLVHVLADGFRFDEAVAAAEEATALKPGHPLVPGAWLRIALAHRRLQRPKEAEKALRDCTRRFPTFAPAWGELGDLLADLDRTDEAVLILEASLKADPSFGRGRVLLARVRTLRGELREAEAEFREFEKGSPPDAESEFYRGLLHQRLSEPEKAVEHLQRSLELDPSRVQCHYLLARSYRDLGREEEAAASMERWRKAEEARRREGHPAAPGSDRKGKEPSKDAE